MHIKFSGTTVFPFKNGEKAEALPAKIDDPNLETTIIREIKGQYYVVANRYSFFGDKALQKTAAEKGYPNFAYSQDSLNLNNFADVDRFILRHVDRQVNANDE